MPRFVVDVAVGTLVQQYLVNHGHDIVCVRDIDPHLPDEQVLDLAVKEKRIVITMDKDFGELVYNSGLLHKGVLLLRLEEQTGEEKAGIVADILRIHGNQLENHFSVYRRGILRIRK